MFTTNLILAHGGVEANPLMAAAQENLGALWWFPKLLLLTAWTVGIVYWVPRLLVPSVVLMAVVVGSNAVQAFRG